MTDDRPMNMEALKYAIANMPEGNVLDVGVMPVCIGDHVEDFVVPEYIELQCTPNPDSEVQRALERAERSYNAAHADNAATEQCNVVYLSGPQPGELPTAVTSVTVREGG